MTGRQTVSLFAPAGMGFDTLVLHGVHWQEEHPASGPAARLFAPLHGVAAAQLGTAAALPGVLLAAEGEHQSPEAGACWVLQYAVRHETGSRALQHWEFVFA